MAKPSALVHVLFLWISRHPRVVIVAILVACLGPFVNKAIHADDPLYVWTGHWIQHHPADFFGFKVNEWYSAIPIWAANWNPPLMSFFLAGAACLLGWSEAALHLAGLSVACLAALGVYSLALRWCQRPLLATLVVVLSPVFLVSSSTLMCDVLMLTCWIWALVLWDRALAGEPRPGLLLIAGVLAGLAVLAKYSAMTLLPLLPILALLRTRKAGWWLLGLAMPLLMVAGYEWMTARMYGTGLLSVAIGHTHSREFPGAWMARAVVGLAFAGGCVLPLSFFAPWLWRPRHLLMAAAMVVGIWLLLFPGWNSLGLINCASQGELERFKHWYFLLQVAFLVAGGLHLLLLTAAEARERRGNPSISLAIVVWILGGLFSAIVLNFAVNARGFLLIVPPAAILLVRRLDAARTMAMASRHWPWPLVPGAAVALSLVFADNQLANSARAAAGKIAAKHAPAGHQLWFEGHGGFQYYMEQFGGQPIDVEQSCLKPGDIVVVPWIGGRVSLPPGSIGWIEGLAFKPFAWMNLLGATKTEAAGFYGANLGPVPFVIGNLPQQDYLVVKVFARVQFNSRPANPEVVRTGGVPSFPHVSFSAPDAEAFLRESAVTSLVQRAGQLESAGQLAAAIRLYRQSLNADPNNPVVLNNLAWLLATASQPELRDAEEAARLANRAIALTDRRWPPFIETLAAAYAAAGEFSKAAQVSHTAYILATLANQPELSAKIDELTSQYAAGKAAERTQAPW